jgi:hypothetical protein
VRLRLAAWIGKHGRKAMRRVPGVLAIVVVVGCASVTPKGQAVRSTRNSEATKGCTFIANVSQPLTLGGPVDTEKALKEKAAKAGGNLVYIGPTNASYAAPMQGEVYRCGEPAAAR